MIFACAEKPRCKKRGFILNVSVFNSFIGHLFGE